MADKELTISIKGRIIFRLVFDDGKTEEVITRKQLDDIGKKVISGFKKMKRGN